MVGLAHNKNILYVHILTRHFLKQSSSVAIRLYATANGCMRNHETRFSTCHPTMAPLLRAPARPLQSLPSSLRFLLRLSTHPKSPIPSQYSNRSSHCPALRPDLHTASLFRKRQQHTSFDRHRLRQGSSTPHQGETESTFGGRSILELCYAVIDQ